MGSQRNEENIEKQGKSSLAQLSEYVVISLSVRSGLSKRIVMSEITHLTRSTMHPHPLQRLCQLYVFINRCLLKYPETCTYRKHTESIIQYRKSILQEAQSVEELECLLACGSMEQLILQAERELNLAKKLLKYKPWEPLTNHPPELQWKWPVL